MDWVYCYIYCPGFDWLGPYSYCSQCTGGDWGACCNWETGECYESQSGECPWDWLGPGTSCAECPVPGACCFHDGHCEQLTEGACTTAGGESWTIDLPCDPNPCPGLPCTAISVRSYRNHGSAGRLYLDMGVSGGVEPRLGGITELEIDLDEASGFGGGVSVDCAPCTWSGSASASADGNTVTVTFDTALPDTCCCEVALDCDAAVCVCGLEGDIDRGGLVSTGDASIIKPHFGDTPTDVDAEFDYDLSGLISTGDFSQVKPKFGNAAPGCP